MIYYFHNCYVHMKSFLFENILILEIKSLYYHKCKVYNKFVPHTRHFTHLIKFFFFLIFPSFLGIIYATIIFIYIIINRLLFLLCVKLHLKKNKRVFYFLFFVLMIVKGLNLQKDNKC